MEVQRSPGRLVCLCPPWRRYFLIVYQHAQFTALKERAFVPSLSRVFFSVFSIIIRKFTRRSFFFRLDTETHTNPDICDSVKRAWLYTIVMPLKANSFCFSFRIHECHSLSPLPNDLEAESLSPAHSICFRLGREVGQRHRHGHARPC